MEHYRLNDTIAAVSTALGLSGIGIVRLSGPKSLDIADKIFFSKRKQSLKDFKSHTIHYGVIKESSREDIIDEVLVSVMKAPKTYTREDIVEINCHGGAVVLGKVLNLCIDRGARAASPGEFTLRAYLNGRIDLSQAEAVMNIVNAKTEEYLRVSTRQLKGELSRIILKIREELLLLVAEYEAVLDFPEESIDESRKEDRIKSLKSIRDNLEILIKHGKEGCLMREGVKGVIVGRPNVGKSSIMNSLLGHDRVIVTSTPGTTRDVIEDIIDLNGLPLRIADTAGMIETDDLIEREGIKRAKDEMDSADLILFILDVAEGLTKEDLFILERLRDKRLIIVLNKIDLESSLDLSDIKALGCKDIVETSAVKNLGIEDLKRAIFNIFLKEKIDLSAPIVTNIRHLESIKDAFKAVDRALNSTLEGLYPELISQDLKLSLDSISSILGLEPQYELLETIFSRFCIGK
jgi:tRNA modification GTPase